MGLCAYTVKKEQGRQRYDWDPQTPETIGQSVVLAVLFFICWDCSGNDFLQSHEHGDEEYLRQFVKIFINSDFSPLIQGFLRRLSAAPQSNSHAS